MGQYWTKAFIADPVGSSTLTAPHYLEDTSEVTITASAGYVLKQIHLLADTGQSKTLTTEVAGKESFTFILRSSAYLPAIAATKKVTITATSEAGTQEPNVPITYTLTGVTANRTTPVFKSETLMLTANANTSFDNVSITFTRGGVADVQTFTKASHPSLFNTENSVLTLALADYWSEDLESIAVTAVASTYATYSEVALTNITSNLTGVTQVKKGDKLILTADEGYEFHKDNDIKVDWVKNGKPSTTIPYNPHYESKYFTMTGDNATVFTLPLADYWDSVTGVSLVSAVATPIPSYQKPPPDPEDRDGDGIPDDPYNGEPPADPDPEPSRKVTYVHVLENVTSNIPTSSSGEKTGVPINTEVVLTAKEGFQFQSTIEVFYMRAFNKAFKKTFHPNAISDERYFNEDKTVFTLNMSEFDEYDVTRVTFYATAKQRAIGEDEDIIEGRTTAFANVYYADDGILAGVVSDRWANTGSDYVDMGEYIYQVYKYPISIGEEYISTDPISIQLGRHKATTKSRYFLRSRVKFSLGKIAVPEEYGNVYDYRDVTCLLHLPYANPIEVDFTYVIGAELELYYLLDLYNGTTTLEVYSSKIKGGLVLRQDIQVAYEIPFMKQAYNDVKGNIGRYVSNKVTTPYIEVIRQIPYDTESKQGKEGKEVGKLGDFTGYVEIRDIELVGGASEIEKRRIHDLLSTGVYINHVNNPTKPQDH